MIVADAENRAHPTLMIGRDIDDRHHEAVPGEFLTAAHEEISVDERVGAHVRRRHPVQSENTLATGKQDNRCDRMVWFD
ncbi:hypothetical protein [Bradyrhizobium sp.]|uniref:hypothetical protein n=1 Tax=Bradyrhizobium sp. TaxID=376 RepID=UPI001EBD82AD|nr:hypothetical protein [Bradyrhizobium sp.]MBV8920136.1 hypothetical protein [Bradyrhizobium sp.]MBV9981093.1 hypothetical protein [Bradyrhizobium sp.]